MGTQKRWSNIVKRILVEKYGNSYHVIVKYRNEIKPWPIIRSGDTEGYHRFCNFLIQCESITQSAKWNQLDAPGAIYMLLAKLPGDTRDKWVRHVLCIQKRQLRDPELEDFIHSVEDDTLLVDDLLLSKSEIDQYCEKSSKDLQNPKHKRKKLKTYLTMADGSKATCLELRMSC